MTGKGSMGVLSSGWTGTVGDYAIAGDWAQGGQRLVVGDAGGSVFGFDGVSGAVVWHADKVHAGGVLALAVHPAGNRVATAGQDGRVQIWSAADGHLDQTLELGRRWVEHLAWSADGQRLAASLSRRVVVFDSDGQAVWRSADHPATVSAIAWSGARELATACYGRVSFFDTSSDVLRQKLQWKGSLVSMALTPDGEVVACGSQDNSVHFWRRSSGHDSMMSGYPGKPSALAFDPTGTILATGGGPTVTVWSFRGDGPEGTRPGSLDLHPEPVTVLTFAKRGMRLASGARDGGVVVWDLKPDGSGGGVGAALVEDLVAGLAWRPDGRSLAAFDARGGVHVWRVRR